MLAVCAEIQIPVAEAMAMIDTNFASDVQTCESDLDFTGSMIMEQRFKAGLGEASKMAVGLTWRSPDVSVTVDVYL